LSVVLYWYTAQQAKNIQTQKHNIPSVQNAETCKLYFHDYTVILAQLAELIV